MPIDYSKWDSIELSDDEDFECHPNVDKKSMVRWKQAQVHKERKERQDQLDLLTLEHQTTEKYLADFKNQVKATFEALSRPVTASAIIDTLKKIQTDTEKTYTDPMRTKSMSCMNAWPREWEAPNWGTVLREHVPWHDTVAKIQEAVSKISQEHAGDNPEKFIDLTMLMIAEAEARLVKRQSLIETQIKALNVEMHKKLTIDHLKTGFDKTIMSKKPEDESMSAAPAADKSIGKDAKASCSTTIETINSVKTKAIATPEKTIQADIATYPGLAEQIMEEYNSTDEELINTHPELLAFSKYGDFGDVLKALKKHSELQKETFEEAILMRALVLEIVGKSKEAKTCVINSLILKYTRALGSSGIDVFFSKLEAGKSSAHNLFFSDVSKTYEHIQRRGKILRAEKIESYKAAIKEKAEHEANIKKIYETFLQADGSLVFPLPETPTERQVEISQWFNNLPHATKEGLLLEDVEKINQFLTTLGPDEAEKNAQFAIEAGFIHVEKEDE
ncbi:hypothetical protein BDV3_006023 [Batrachochytrium dendrobatidis]|uniref:Hsp90 chaperone protein kinase-targeting subunit n=1 Tax=Batrachochytrium dendrobatidis (strain JEL423) TaxID=403673 RepID=A0A177WNZ7_BATDL|nr:hsp90 co-chaperone Cdc37 [Batrachochytrium dendrobatidis]OAJ41160.1 hypothetical protein BDEG_24801 [Batrachochytrium dendrobatidis JEL423]